MKFWTNRDYLNAAINAFWCLQYCKHGEPYGISPEELYSSQKQAYNIYYKASKKFKSCELSKTTFVYGNICPKLLWLYKNKCDNRKISQQTQMKFYAGHIIGNLAQKLFKDGVDASSSIYTERIIDETRIYLPFNLKQRLWTNRTQILCQHKTVFEAAFTHEDAFTAVDILEKTETGHVAYEVKYSNSITDAHLTDCSFQYYVISQNCKLDDFFLIYINQNYLEEIHLPIEKVNETNVDLQRLFIIESVISRILPLQPIVENKINTYKEILTKKMPVIEIGEHCNKPYDCMFKYFCSDKSDDEYF